MDQLAGSKSIYTTGVLAKRPTLTCDNHEEGIDLDSYITGPQGPRVMIVDSDPKMLSEMKLILRRNGYDVIGAGDASQALKKYALLLPDLVLMDIKMSGCNGYEVMRQMRQLGNAPIIFVSAKTTDWDVVEGLQAGADDYIIKPFHDAELVARVQSVLRRSEKGAPARRLVFPNIGLVIDMKTRQVSFMDQEIHLSNQEFEILALLARHPDEPVTQQAIALEVWGEASRRVNNRIKYLIYLLRRKLGGDTSQPSIIVTHGRMGYSLQIYNHRTYQNKDQ
jgi:two-component system KDP operon response regulator KdpE